MNKKKKVGIAAASFAGIIAAIVAGTLMNSNAYYVDKENKGMEGKAGQVEIAPEQITINNMSAYITGNGVDIDMGRYMTTGGTIEGSDGWVPEGNVTQINTYNPVWTAIRHKEGNCGGYVIKNASGYNCATCNVTFAAYDSSKMARGYVFPNFFRTKDGKVAYCMDMGKVEPSDGMCNMSTPVSTAAKRILAKGYPQMKGADYGILDAELEWCTQIALYLVEGTGYTKDGVLVPNSGLTLDMFNTKYTYLDANREAAEKQLDVIKQLVGYASDPTVDAVDYRLNASYVGISQVSNGHLVGPYLMETKKKNRANKEAKKVIKEAIE